jgi:ribosomal protein S27E
MKSMKSTKVDLEGNVTCPKCGTKNQFAIKRGGKAKLIGIATVEWRVKCLGCGTSLRMMG